MTSFRAIEPDDVKSGMFIKVTEVCQDEDQEGVGPVRVTYEGEVTEVTGNPSAHILLAQLGPYATAYLQPPRGGGVTVENLMVRLPDLPPTNGSVIRYRDDDEELKLAVRIRGEWFEADQGADGDAFNEGWLVEHLHTILFEAGEV